MTERPHTDLLVPFDIPLIVDVYSAFDDTYAKQMTALAMREGKNFVVAVFSLQVWYCC